MNILPHGDGRSFATCLLIGVPPDNFSSGCNFIVEIHPTEIKPVFSNPMLNVQIPPTLGSDPISTAAINLRRLAITPHIVGNLYNTDSGNARNNIGYDHCYIEQNENEIFNSTTGAINITGMSSRRVTNCLQKVWMLDQLAQAGATAGRSLTLQRFGISDTPTSSPVWTQNIYHNKTTITNYYPDFLDFSQPHMVDSLTSPTTMDVDKVTVTLDLLWGDPTG